MEWQLCTQCQNVIDASNPYAAVGVCSFACFMARYFVENQIDDGELEPLAIPLFADER